MIKKITLKNIASFQESSLETDREINLMYGLNGTGKTTISEYLQTLDSEDYTFKDCCIEGFDKNTQKILVYNRKFIEENFYESETQKGVFTLAKENKEVLQTISDAQNEKKTLKSKLDDEENGFNKKIEEKQKEIENNLEASRAKTWEIKTEYTGGDRVFDEAGFLDGLKGQKKELFTYISKIKLDGTPTKTIDDIKKELGEIGEYATQRAEIPYVESKIYTTLEQEEIFKEEIIGNQSSTVSGLIKTLKNSDWVKQGLKYVDLKESINCPFCQEETLTENLVKNINSYFDTTYEVKIKTLGSLQTKYQQLQTNLDANKKDFFTTEQDLEIENLFTRLNKIIENNLKKIEGKIKQPSTIIQLQHSQQAIEHINTWIEERNKEINEFNKKLENKKQTIQGLKDEFWRIQRKEYDPTIVHYQNTAEKLEREKQSIDKKIENITQEIEKQDYIIETNQKKVTNIEQTIDVINTHLLDFGIQDLKIVKHGENEYKIQRGEETSEEIFKSLSEGEKTIISFLYFVELSKGQESRVDTKEKIIVIDDPISSLSHMYVFNVAQLIKSTFFSMIKQKKNFLQCFVLTHSLYFFHELVNKNELSEKDDKKKKQKLFRIEKTNPRDSQILDMKDTEIQNEYESYWYIVNNATQENKFIVANAMRNIIEYFFGFMEGCNGVNNIFQKKEFKGSEFQAFKRYMDRESHSDRQNIHDYKEFDIDIFKKAFEKVFTVTEYQEHYKKFGVVPFNEQ